MKEMKDGDRQKEGGVIDMATRRGRGNLSRNHNTAWGGFLSSAEPLLGPIGT